MVNDPQNEYDFLNDISPDVFSTNPPAPDYTILNDQDRSHRAQRNWGILKNRLMQVMEERFPGSRMLHEDYWLEKLDPRHESIEVLGRLFP